MNDLSEILDSFIVQAKTDDLKTLSYPKGYSDLKMKVSFGQGVAARVPWIAFTAPEMQVSEGFYPVYLFFKASNKLILAYGISETSEYHSSWPDEILHTKQTILEYLADNVPRYGGSYVFRSYIPEIVGQSVNYRQDQSEKEVSPEALANDLKQILDYYKRVVSLEVRNEDSLLSQGLFYMEKQLEDFIIHNWEQTELAKKYELIVEEGELVSQQYPTDIGRIDILAKDKETNSYVVIELKKNQTSDDTVGQLARYMGWIKEKKRDEGVKGIIIAGQFDKKLEYAINMFPNTEVFLYKVDFKLEEYQ